MRGAGSRTYESVLLTLASALRCLRRDARPRGLVVPAPYFEPRRER
jgi:hypothetical protein